jgi:AcrR family transcriptional regulator
MRQAPTRVERKARTRSELLDAAERLFSEQGFHATSVDAVADGAGYTKGAVYSNFASKEDLFLAVYERRVDAAVAEIESRLADGSADRVHAVEQIAAAAAVRGGGDGWLAVFFEFWAHVLRNPELRERFAAQHARAMEPTQRSLERLADERGIELAEEPAKLNAAFWAMELGLMLERLTQPDVVDADLGTRMVRISIEGVSRDGSSGLSGKTPARRRRGARSKARRR